MGCFKVFVVDGIWWLEDEVNLFECFVFFIKEFWFCVLLSIEVFLLFFLFLKLIKLLLERYWLSGWLFWYLGDLEVGEFLFVVLKFWDIFFKICFSFVICFFRLCMLLCVYIIKFCFIRYLSGSMNLWVVRILWLLYFIFM